MSDRSALRRATEFAETNLIPIHNRPLKNASDNIDFLLPHVKLPVPLTGHSNINPLGPGAALVGTSLPRADIHRPPRGEEPESMYSAWTAHDSSPA